MNRKLFCLLSLIIILSLVTGSAGVLAQGPQPPKPVMPPGKVSPYRSPGYPMHGAQPLRLQPRSIDQENAPSVELGQPGLSFRYVQTFGITEQAYPADFQHLNHPTGLFIDSNNLYLVEEMGSRMLKYRLSDGANLLSIGVAGSHIIEDYKFSWPKDVTLDGDGNIWVVDSNRVTQYSPDGTFMQVFPTWENSPWECYNDNEGFCDPYGIDFDNAGRMYVSDAQNSRVQVFDFVGGTPVYSATIGITGVSGSDNLHFDYPARINIDGSDQLYVADVNNFRIQRCTYTAGWSCTTFHGTGSQGNGINQLSLAYGLRIDSNNNIYIADAGNQRVKKCTSGGSCTVFASGFNWVSDVAVDTSGNVYANDYFDEVTKKYSSTGTFLGVFAGVNGVPYLTDNTRLNFPWGVAVAQDGSIYITEEFGNRLVKLSAAGAQQWSVGEAGVIGQDNAHFGDWWSGIQGNPAVDAVGRVYVPDTGNQRVQIYNSNGTIFATIGVTRESGDDNAHFDCPHGIAISPLNGDIYVTDSCNQRVQIFNSSRDYKATLGVLDQIGNDNAHFNNPWGVTVDNQGYIYIADTDNHRVQVFNSSLVYQRTLGTTSECGWDYDHLCYPTSLAMDASRRLYIADESNVRLQVFDSTGAYLTTIGGSWGENPGQLRAASGVAVDISGNVYVTDPYNHRVQKYAPGVPGWGQKNINGFGDRNSTGVPSLEIFDDQFYAGTFNWNIGASIWRSPDGSSWTAVTEPGFGSVYTNTNPAILDLIVFDGQLYAGTGWGGVEGQIWRSPDGTTWTNVTDNDFDNPNNESITLFTIFDNNLYAAAGNPTTGLEIWRSDTGNSSDWDPVVTDGFDSNPNNTNPTGFATLNEYLYVATEGPEDPDGGLEIWRTDTGNTGSWAPVNDPGFGDPDNFSAGGMAVYKGFLYVGTWNKSTGAQIWRTDTGISWEPVINDGFGDSNNYKIDTLYVFDNKLYAGANNDQTGVEIWRTSDGSNWSQINPDGFGDSNNLAIVLWSNGITSFNGRLYMGTLNNANGGEVWQLLKQIYLPVLKR